MFTTLHLLQPRNFPNWFRFGVRYGGGMYCQGFVGATNVEELRGRLEGVMIRRLKSEVKGELPSLTRAKMPVVPSNMKMYWAVKHEDPDAIKTMRAGRETASKDYFENGLEKLTLLREVVGQGKVDAAIDWADSFLGQTPAERKLVIYAHHDSVVQALKAGLTEWGVGCIIGGVSKKERDAIQRNFQTALMPRVLIISSAGGIGIDLFGIEEIQCSDLLVVEREWTSADEEQVESRLHRQGQHDAVNVWILVAKGTNDEDNDELIDARRALMDDVIRVNKFKSISAELIQRMEAEDEDTVRKGKHQVGEKGRSTRVQGGRNV
jgi:SNF2 family DNA or RNA helicase